MREGVVRQKAQRRTPQPKRHTVRRPRLLTRHGPTARFAPGGALC
jgi:hypothetical protein